MSNAGYNQIGTHRDYLDGYDDRLAYNQVAENSIYTLGELQHRPTSEEYIGFRLVRAVAIGSPVELPTRPLAVTQSFTPITFLPMTKDPRAAPDNEQFLIERSSNRIHQQIGSAWRRPAYVGYLLSIENPEQHFSSELPQF